jgi:hypothetical protein
MLQGARLVLIAAAGGYGEGNTKRLEASAFDQALPCVFAHPRRALIFDTAGGGGGGAAELARDAPAQLAVGGKVTTC